MNQRRIVLRIWKENLALSGFLTIQSPADADTLYQAGHEADKGPAHALLGDQESDTAFGIVADSAHQHEGVDELVGVRGGDEDDGAFAGDAP